MEVATHRTETLPAEPWHARKSSRFGGVSPGDPDAAFEHGIRAEPERRLRCRVCGAPITSPDERIPIAGSPIHRRVNPAGIEFEFGCFAEAPGAAVTGEPTAEFSWFAGYVWSYALCRRCGVHLGWLFEGATLRFYGLILNRLTDEDFGA